VGIHTELFMLLRDKWRSLLGRCSPNYISDKKLGDLLRQWAGEEDEGDANNAGAADKRKLLTVSGEGEPPTARRLGGWRLGLGIVLEASDASVCSPAEVVSVSSAP
jgi:hypothetical protein